MKVTEMMLHKWGVKDPVVQKNVMNGMNGEDTYLEEMEEKVTTLTEELEAVKKQAAVERAILEAGGRNVKAIRALIDMDCVQFEEKNGLTGLDLEEVKAEAPYLFHEKEEKMRGTGTSRGQKKKENEISAAFKKGLRR